MHTTTTRFKNPNQKALQNPHILVLFTIRNMLTYVGVHPVPLYFPALHLSRQYYKRLVRQSTDLSNLINASNSHIKSGHVRAFLMLKEFCKTQMDSQIDTLRKY